MVPVPDMQKRLKSDLARILDPIDPYLKKVDEQIRLKLSTGVPLIDESALYLFEGGGKKIRASLVILSAGMRVEPSDEAIDLAAAAEIVHCASLIHDDIIDQSLLRRGVPTVSRRWGSRVAVLVGDYMYTTALKVAVGEGAYSLFPVLVAATSDMVKGELYQLEYSGIDRIDKRHYFTIIELKTARFMAACMKMGGAKGGFSNEESDVLYGAGLNMGFAFQIVDDALDVMDDSELTGKDGGNDFFEGKVTLPFLHLLEKADSAERARLVEYSKSPSAEGWGYVRSRIRDEGGVEYALEAARDYNRRFLEAMDAFPSSPYKDIILQLSKFLVERNY